MNEKDFIGFVELAISRITQNIGTIGYLICTQSRNSAEPTLREPELRTAFQLEAQATKRYYGIEVPTRYTYRSRSGRCMIHICQAANSGTVPAVIQRYQAVIKLAKGRAADTLSKHATIASSHPDCWFLLFILVLHVRGQVKGAKLMRYRLNGSDWQFEAKIDYPHNPT